jgi:hypothetical protein
VFSFSSFERFVIIYFLSENKEFEFDQILRGHASQVLKMLLLLKLLLHLLHPSCTLTLLSYVFLQFMIVLPFFFFILKRLESNQTRIVIICSYFIIYLFVCESSYVYPDLLNK